VKANRVRCDSGEPATPLTCTDRAQVGALAKPVFSTAHVAPPSSDEKTPRSVPTNRRLRWAGSMAMVFTGTSGSAPPPLPSSGDQVAPPSVVFHTWAPPKVAKVA
jgi:hypothetical protein